MKKISARKSPRRELAPIVRHVTPAERAFEEWVVHGGPRYPDIPTAQLRDVFMLAYRQGASDEWRKITDGRCPATDSGVF